MPRETPGTLLVMSYRETRLHGFERNDVYLVLLHWCESFSLGGVKISGVLLTTDSWAHHQQGHFQHCLKAQPKSASQNTCLTSSRPPGSCLCSLKCLHVCVFFFLIYFFFKQSSFFSAAFASIWSHGYRRQLSGCLQPSVTSTMEAFDVSNQDPH